MDNAKRALLDALRGFESQFKDVKEECKKNLHLETELKKKSIPAKYKGPIQRLMDEQTNMMTSRLAVAFKCKLKEVLLHFANNNNPDVNGYAIDVVEMLTCGIVGNPEDNLINQLMDKEVGHVPDKLATLEVKVKEPTSTLAEPKTMIRNSLQSRNNEEYNQVYEDVQGQSSASVKKTKLDCTQRKISQSVDQSRHRCITEHCGLSFNNFNDLEQHIKLAHSRPNNNLAISVMENTLTAQNTNVGPIVSRRSSILTEPTTMAPIRFEVPIDSRLEARNIEECIDVDDQGQSSTSVKKVKLNSTQSDHAQSQVTSQSELTAEAKEEMQILHKNAMVRIGLNCFQLDCEQLFDTKEALNLHMWERHRIRAFPCLVKGCAKSCNSRRVDAVGVITYEVVTPIAASCAVPNVFMLDKP